MLQRLLANVALLFTSATNDATLERHPAVGFYVFLRPPIATS